MKTPSKALITGMLLFSALMSVVTFTLSAAEGKVYVTYVLENNANVRAEPTATARAVYSAPQSTVLEVVDHETQPGWLQVVTPGGDRGWILKTATVFQKEGSVDPAFAKKGVVDREYASKEILKWWDKRANNATPVCDICSARVPAKTGYLLTAKQVLAARTYHDLLKRKSQSTERYNQLVARFEQDRTPWIICEKCIDTHFLDMPGSSSPTELAAALEVNDDLRRRKLEAIRKQFTLEQFREKMRSGQVWIVEDPVQKNRIYPINPAVDGWLLKALEKPQEPKPPGPPNAP